MGDLLIMSTRERKRKVIVEDVLRDRLKLIDAAPKLGVGYRQAKRILASYRSHGDAGLTHGNRGKRSSHAYPNCFKQRVIGIYQEKYLGFGPTFAAEKLLEFDEIKVHAETLRLWLLEAKLWSRARQRKAYRQRRQRRERFGEMLQIDGSDHAWFGRDKPRNCLLNIVDDAAGVTLSEMDTGETCKVLLSSFRKWVEKYGVPKSVYVDLKNLYVSPKREVDHDLESTMNVFERVCKLLDVEIIKAYSPQAKGRVERNHGIYQDRFVKELYLRDIKTIEEANCYLQEAYLDKINKKFAKKPVSSEDAHISASAYGDLDQIFCWEYVRQIRNDFTIRFENNFYQLQKSQKTRLRTKQKVQVRRHLDDSISIWRERVKLGFEKLVLPPNKQVNKIAKEISSTTQSLNGKKGKRNSPWSRMPAGWLSPKRMLGETLR